MQNFFAQRGYFVDSNALNIIYETNEWYRNTEKSFHRMYTVNNQTYDLERMNFAKRVCADDANLIEAIDITVSENDDVNGIVKKILADNKFKKMYRKQTEQMSANGTVGCYVRIDDADLYEDGTFRGGKIRLEYCDTLSIFPLTVINDEIVEVAFYGANIVDSKRTYTIVMFTKNERGNYVAETHYFNEYQEEDDTKTQIVELSDVKPFAIMRVAEDNNLDMRGYGYPKLWSSIASLKILDLSMTMWSRDLEKSDKMLLINEALGKYDPKTGKIKPPSPQMKKIFVQVGKDKLPDEKSLVQEFNPEVRIDQVVKSIETALSLLSMSFGYGTKKYTFENGRIVTATEYIGDRQDAMQEVNKQRDESIDYITDIVKAIVYFYNLTQGTNISVDEVDVDFDDSYIEDRNSVADSMRQDALSFNIPKLTEMYLKKKYGFDDDDVKEIMNAMADEPDDGEEFEE